MINKLKITGYEDYNITHDGKVYSTKTKRYLRPQKDKDGYLKVILCKHAKTKCISVHRLVANHFVSNPENKPCVDHIDGDILNNNKSNLRWTTIKENANNPITRKRKSARQKFPIVCNGIEYKNQTQASKMLGISRTAINNNLRGLSERAGGLIFTYK